MTVDPSMQTVESVRLDMDYKGYETGAQRASAATSALLTQLDKLGNSLDNMRNKAGNRALAGGLGITAGLTLMTKQAADYEQAMSTINAKQAMVGKGMGSLDDQIGKLTRSLPLGRSEVISYTGALQEFGITGEKSVNKTITAMARLSATTGEAIPTLTRQVLDFSRAMGKIEEVDKISASVGVASARQGASAGQTLQFGASIAPFARTAGINTTDTIGLSTAFSKSGADGFAGANLFGSIIGEIQQQVQTGSPALAKWSNLIGKTNEEFSQMGAADQFEAIVAALNKMGDDLPNELQRLGIGGVRQQRAIQQLGQGGGIASARADAAYGASAKGQAEYAKTADAALSGLADTATKIRSDFSSVSLAIGEKLLPPVTKAADIFSKLVAPLNDLLRTFSGPVALLGVGMAALLLTVKALTAAYKSMAGISFLQWLMKASPMQGLITGMKDSRAVLGGRPGDIAGSPFAGRSGPMAWAGQRAYNAGAIGLTAINDGRPGPSAFGRAAGFVGRGGGMWYGGVATMGRDAMAWGSDRAAIDSRGRWEDRPGRPGQQVRVRGDVSGMQGSGGNWIRAADRIEKLARLDVRNTEPGFRNAAVNTTRAMGSATLYSTMGAAALGSRGVGAAAGALGGALGPTLAIGGLMAAYSKMQSNQASNMERVDASSMGSNAYREALGQTTRELLSFKDAIAAAKKEAKPPEVDDKAGLTSKEIQYAAGTEVKAEGAKGIQSRGDAETYLAMYGGASPEMRTQAEMDVVRSLGTGLGGDVVNQAKSGSSMTPEEATQKYIASSLAGTFKGSKLSDQEAQRLTGGIGQQNERFVENIDKYGEASAVQSRFNEVLDTVIEMGGSNPGAMNLLVKKYQEAGVLGGDISSQRVTEDAAKAKNKSGKFSPEEQRQATEDLITELIGGSESAMSRENLDKTGVALSPNRAVRENAVVQLREGYVSPRDSIYAEAGEVGSRIKGNEAIAAALDKEANPRLQVEGADQMKATFMDLSGTGEEADKSLRVFISKINQTNDPLQRLAQSALASVQGDLRRQRVQGTAGPGGMGGRESVAVGAQRDYIALRNAPKAVKETEGYGENLQAAKDSAKAESDNYREFLAGLVKAYRDYQVSMERQQRDYGKQRARMEYDYNLQVSQSIEDFNTSRLRSQEDFNLQMERMVEDAAKSLYDPYTRAQSQYTYGAQSMLTNLKQQQKLMEEQASAVEKLSGMGLSQDAINQLGLLDPKNRQQAIKLAEQMGQDPEMIDAYNKAIEGRLDAAKGLTLNKDSEEWQRMRDDFDRAADRAEADFDKSMKRGRAAYKRQLSLMAQDHATAMSDARADMARMTEEVTGDINDVATEAIALIGKNIPSLGTKIIAEINRVKGEALAAEREMNAENAAGTAAGTAAGGDPGLRSTNKADTAERKTATAKGHAHAFAEGGIVTRALMGEMGVHEAVIPLNRSGTTFMTEMVSGVMREIVRSGAVAGLGISRGTNTSTNTTFADQSTNIRVERVETASAEDFMNQMESKKRSRQLVRPRSKP